MRLDVGFIRSYMLIFGTLSSIFDFITLYLLYVVMRADAAPCL